MKIIRPSSVTDAVLVSSNVPEDETQWNNGTTYGLGALVRGHVSPFTHTMYSSVIASNSANNPTTDDGSKWVVAGYSNRWRMFDSAVNSQTTRADNIVVELRAPGYVDSVALLNVTAGTIRIEQIDDEEGTVFDQTFDMTSDSGITDWYAYFFEPIVRVSDLAVFGLKPYPSSIVKVTITNTGGTARVGALVLGLSKVLGDSAAGANVGIIDFSRKERTAFGDDVVRERPFSKRATIPFWCDRSKAAEVQNILADFRATPIVYVGSEEDESTILYGFYRDFNIELTYQLKAVCSINIESLI
jgi:hypothetical protein